jgi:hypothetical protein
VDASGVLEGPGVNVVTVAGVLVDVGGFACVGVAVDVGGFACVGVPVDVGGLAGVGVSVGAGVAVVGAQLARTRHRMVRKMILFIVVLSTMQLIISEITFLLVR